MSSQGSLPSTCGAAINFHIFVTKDASGCENEDRYPQREKNNMKCFKVKRFQFRSKLLNQLTVTANNQAKHRI